MSNTSLAQSNEPNRSNIYDKARILDFDKYVSKKNRYSQVPFHWKQIPRANNPKKPLSSKALFLLATLVFKLRKNEVITLNHNFLNMITACKKDQNVNLLKQLDNILDISYHAKTTITGKICRNSYVIKHTEKGQEIIENAEALHEQIHFVNKVAVIPVEKPTTNDKINTCNTEFLPSSYIYKEKVLENNRSNESSFLENSNSSNLQPEILNFVEIENEVVTKKGGNQATIHTLKPNTAQHSIKPANQRKKPTNAGIKAKRAKLLHFKQYDKPKSLADHQQIQI